jgi:hypothetical protein
MNRLAMAEKIARLVPMLAKRDSDEWKRAEQLRTDFVADYPLKRIAALSLDEYVIGKTDELTIISKEGYGLGIVWYYYLVAEIIKKGKKYDES